MKKKKKPSSYFAREQRRHSEKFSKTYTLGGALSYNYRVSSSEDIHVIAETIFGNRYGYKANG